MEGPRQRQLLDRSRLCYQAFLSCSRLPPLPLVLCPWGPYGRARGLPRPNEPDCDRGDRAGRGTRDGLVDRDLVGRGHGGGRVRSHGRSHDRARGRGRGGLGARRTDRVCQGHRMMSAFGGPGRGVLCAAPSGHAFRRGRRPRAGVVDRRDLPGPLECRSRATKRYCPGRSRDHASLSVRCRPREAGSTLRGGLVARGLG